MKDLARFLGFSSSRSAPGRGECRHAIAAWATRHVVFLVLALLITAGLLPNAATAAANDDAVIFMRDLLSRAIGVLNDKLPAADRQERFRQMFDVDFDGPRIARFVLGPYWRQASPAAQQQFVKLFESYVVLVYSTRLADFNGETFRVRGSRPDAEGVVVLTEFFTSGHPTPLRVDWRVITDGGDLKIVDVVVDGISMLVTERSEFASVIRRHGGDLGGLLAMMREKLAGVRLVEQ
jgi:phospholipid transport system substrate-binding protein